MANYIMSAYKIPKESIKSLRSKQSTFRWEKTDIKFCRLRSWEKVCQPKVSGDVGIRDPFILNQALV